MLKYLRIACLFAVFASAKIYAGNFYFDGPGVITGCTAVRNSGITNIETGELIYYYTCVSFYIADYDESAQGYMDDTGEFFQRVTIGSWEWQWHYKAVWGSPYRAYDTWYNWYGTYYILGNVNAWAIFPIFL